MLRLLEDLPVELVGTNVFGYLSLKDIVMLERACGNMQSHKAFMEQIPHRPPVVLPSSKHTNIETLYWFAKRQCTIKAISIQFSGNNPCLSVKNLQVVFFDLLINSNITMQSWKPLLESNTGCKVFSITISGTQNREVMDQLSVCIGNVKQLTIRNSGNCIDWLTADILSRWNTKKICLEGSAVTTPLVSLLVQTRSELTSIKLDSNTVDDAAVIAIAQHCTKLETLLLRSSNITWTSLLVLSERCLPLAELDIPFIPNIPTADIARRCSHALSCIRHLNTNNLYKNGQDANILIPYMTGLTRVYLYNYCDSYIPLLTQYCNNIIEIEVYCEYYSFSNILSLCRANPLLKEFHYFPRDLTDTTLIELIDACPHLHTLRLPYDTDISDISILALSEHCTQLQKLSITKCHKITEAAVLQLLQRCRKLARLCISSSSLSEESWTKLDKNTQKRVRRW